MKSSETQIPVSSLSSDLRTTNCLNCGAKSEQVLNMEIRKRVGWYCLKCKYFEKAILREREL